MLYLCARPCHSALSFAFNSDIRSPQCACAGHVLLRVEVMCVCYNFAMMLRGMRRQPITEAPSSSVESWAPNDLLRQASVAVKAWYG